MNEGGHGEGKKGRKGERERGRGRKGEGETVLLNKALHLPSALSSVAAALV